MWKLTTTNPSAPAQTRISMDKMAAAMVFLAQGIPFIQAGQEFLRSKPLPGGTFDHNSYKSPDVINSLKWDRKSEYKSVVDYYKGLITLRKTHTAFRFPTKEEIDKNMRFLDRLPARVVGFTLTGDCTLEEIIVFLNPNDYEIKLFAFEKYNVYADGNSAGAEILYTVEGDFSVAPYSIIVLGREYPAETPQADTEIL